MDASDVVELSFGGRHFGEAKLGDERLTQRAVLSADAMLKHPGGTLPEKFATNAQLFGFYDFCNNPKVTHQRTMAAHVEHTLERVEARSGVVLILHDTTELDFSGLDIADLGQIGHGGCRGLLCHNSLALDYANREALGLVSQILHRRRQVPKGETPTAKRNHPERESRLWRKAVESLPAGAAGGGLRVHVADRGADCFEFMECIEQRKEGYVIRSKSNRRVDLAVEAAEAERTKLHDWARKLPHAGRRIVHVSANHNQPEREARVRVAYGSMRILAPHPKRGEHGNGPLVAWVIHVKEENPPAGCQALEWILLTNVPVNSLADAWERIDWYGCRPVIEEYHKAQKTGCCIESPQFTTRKALEVAVAMLSVVATQLLRLRDLSRQKDASTRPASEVVDRVYVEALSLWRFRKRREDLSVWDFFWALAKLGGHLNRKQDKRPGWLVLWRGWTKLQLLVEGMVMTRGKR